MQTSRRWAQPRSRETDRHNPDGLRSDCDAPGGDGKWPLHWRGRFILGLSLISRAIAIGAAWLIWRAVASVLA